MASRLETDAAYYRDCAKECRKLRAAIEADINALNGDDATPGRRDAVLLGLETDIALWEQLADEIEAHLARDVDTIDLLSEVT